MGDRLRARILSRYVTSQLATVSDTDCLVACYRVTSTVFVLQSATKLEVDGDDSSRKHAQTHVHVRRPYGGCTLTRVDDLPDQLTLLESLLAELHCLSD